MLLQCKTKCVIPALDHMQLTLCRADADPEDSSPFIPVVLLLHKGAGMAAVDLKGAAGADNEVSAVWPKVDGRIQGKAWWGKAQLLQKVVKHHGFVNTLSVLQGTTPASSARIFRYALRRFIQSVGRQEEGEDARAWQ